jgi:AraC-like DNA-binding protein
MSYRPTPIGTLVRYDRRQARNDVLEQYRLLGWITSDVATHFGVSRRQMIRIANELGLARAIAIARAKLVG